MNNKYFTTIVGTLLIVGTAIAFTQYTHGPNPLNQEDWIRNVGNELLGVKFADDEDDSNTHLERFCALWWFRTGQNCNPETFKFNNWPITFIAKVNEIRKNGGWCGNTYNQPTTPLIWSWDLQNAAINQIKDQKNNGYKGHISPTGESARTFAKAEGYNYWVRDNLAWGYHSDDAVLDAWLADPAHCEPLFDPESKRAAGHNDGVYWNFLMGWDGYTY
jgi:hypothetical protein